MQTELTTTAVRTIRLSTGTFDYDAKFGLEVRGLRSMKTITVSLQRDKKVAGDGIYWALKGTVSVQASYSNSEFNTMRRVHQQEAPLRHGDLVRIERESTLFRVKVIGDYMDAAIFEPTNIEA
jgi:hypothetical protein